MGRFVSIGPKNAGGVSPKCPFHRFTANGSQPSPSTAIVLSGPPKVIAGSLSPLWSAGFDEKPGGNPVNGARSTVFENVEALAAAAVTMQASAHTPSNRIRFHI